MAQNVTINGAEYSDVPAVDIPKTGGGVARFSDTSDTTATAPDVAQGKAFHLPDGTLTVGTNTGKLNGFSFEMGANGEVILTYTNPDDASDVQTATFPTETTGEAIVDELVAINESLIAMIPDPQE